MRPGQLRPFWAYYGSKWALSGAYPAPRHNLIVEPFAGSAGYLHVGGHTWLQRWEHWACPIGSADEHMAQAGWARVPIPGKTWRSGRQAYRIQRSDQLDIFG